jgi:hypothetical protein
MFIHESSPAVCCIAGFMPIFSGVGKEKFHILETFFLRMRIVPQSRLSSVLREICPPAETGCGVGTEHVTRARISYTGTGRAISTGTK